MASVNDLIADQALSHAVDMQQYSNNVVRRIVAVLNRSDARLYAELSTVLERVDPSNFSVERLSALLYSARIVNLDAYAQASQALTSELQALVEYEAAYQRQALVSLLPLQVHVAAVSAEQTYAAALSRPFQGVLLKDVLRDLELSKSKKILQAVAQGFIEGKTSDQIVRELRGTKAKSYSDGSLSGSLRDVEAVVRTALGHMAGFTQDRFIEANVDLVKSIVWSATLDLRTSGICRVRDGKQYASDTHKPIGHLLPWLSGPSRSHWRCRSYQTTVLKSFSELGVDLPEVVVKGKTRASMDGQTPAETTYAEWLKKQSAERQAQVLGPTRAKLMRVGKLPLEAMYTQKGVYKTLDQLRASDKAAFDRAGV